ncbi:MAG: hypothetical protein LDLANPLL_02821 [Turneriella sp.]|nr:hypothetical protein [Turneriella sp.]
MVVRLAADYPNAIQAVIAQVPYLKNSKNLEPKDFTLVRFVFLTLLDLLRSFLRRTTKIRLPPVYVTVFGKPNEFAFSKSKENISKKYKKSRTTLPPFWQAALRPLRGGWKNKMLARVFSEMAEYEPMGSVDKISQPVYFVSATQDEEVLPEFIQEAYNRVKHPNKKITEFPCRHYDIYLGDTARENANSQAAFLQKAFKK